MGLQRSVVVTSLFTIACLSFTKNVVLGAVPGERSKEMCTKYLEMIPDSYECPFIQQSLAIGNKFAVEEEFPHMVMLGYNKSSDISWRCSAMLISDQYVLCAAHCLNGESDNPVVVRLGATNLTDLTHRVDVKVSEVIPHPDYHILSTYNDIGLVKLEKKPQTGGALNIIHKESGMPRCIYDVVGVASFGKLVTDTDVPSVYTRVSAYIKWIEDNVWK